ncbi:MAG: RNA 3'-terminal phosphate cyclase, partial [Planctomycetales bacterium]|nr:RNA 3'-terminal phosphate cyclase [Planctomycetales bacterium]
MLIIDGSQGEGGGQILRSTLSLALVSGLPVRIENIRAGRSKPGVMRQHLTAIRAAALISSADVRGADVGASCVEFVPGEVRAGEYEFAVGTAGSGTLVLQTVLPALMFCKTASRLTIEGGTHNAWAPPFDFLSEAYFPAIRQLGVVVDGQLQRHGFYPAGGGRFHVNVAAATCAQRFALVERGEFSSRRVRAVVAHLPGSIAERELKKAAQKLNWPSECFEVCEASESLGPGNIVMAYLQSAKVSEVFIAFGRHGVAAEKVAYEVVDQVRRYCATSAPVGPYLA